MTPVAYSACVVSMDRMAHCSRVFRAHLGMALSDYRRGAGGVAVCGTMTSVGSKAAVQAPTMVHGRT
jgi:hypothetical protein